MCRLAAITSKDYFSPIDNILALETMKEGHDGSGMGLMLKDLGGVFEEFKDFPILSGICSREGYDVLREYMLRMGFEEKYTWTPKIKRVHGIEAKDYYFAKVYQYPESFRDKPQAVKDDLLVQTRVRLREMGEGDESIVVFSFYPDE